MAAGDGDGGPRIYSAATLAMVEEVVHRRLQEVIPAVAAALCVWGNSASAWMLPTCVLKRVYVRGNNVCASMLYQLVYLSVCIFGNNVSTSMLSRSMRF